MLKSQIIHPELLYELSKLGHTDVFVIADAGLPVPLGKKRIDLAFAPGRPGFLEVLEVVLRNVVVEKAVLASEIKDRNPEVHKRVLDLIEANKASWKNFELKYVPHEEFKAVYVASSRFVVRTGEYTPYSNIALVAGVPF
ncbi:D-ribose pyranase [Thermogladius sp.]|uniref:D-ribose pyranase n=1 Tax=Thermogladius sp. TaxID=2023064 RepID=UPI003D13D1B2